MSANTLPLIAFRRKQPRRRFSALVPLLLAFILPDAARCEEGFEQPGPVDAREFLPAKVFENQAYRVEPEAYNDGLMNTYQIVTELDQYGITGTHALLERLRELAAIDQLRNISEGSAFKDALKRSAKETAGAARAFAKDPVTSLKHVPQGAKRFFGRIGDTLRGDEGDEGLESEVGGLLGVSKAKRELAFRLGVDPDSPNPTLQEQLERVARASAAGGLSLDIGKFFVGGPVLTGIDISQTVEETLRTSTPEELRRSNRQKLRSLGAGDARATEFFEHPWYSPRQETVIIEALQQVGADPDIFLEMACEARTHLEALFYQDVAALLSKYGKADSQIEEYTIKSNLLCARTTAGTLAVPVPFDYAIWTPAVASRADSLAAMVTANGPIKRVELWTDGKVSPKLESELGRRQIGIRAGL
jgi:hypothetical protein